jgi:hypothetical protein
VLPRDVHGPILAPFHNETLTKTGTFYTTTFIVKIKKKDTKNHGKSKGALSPYFIKV